jgi:hypothetical protein
MESVERNNEARQLAEPTPCQESLKGFLVSGLIAVLVGILLL